MTIKENAEKREINGIFLELTCLEIFFDAMYRIVADIEPITMSVVGLRKPSGICITMALILLYDHPEFELYINFAIMCIILYTVAMMEYTIEAIGTFFLVLTIALTGNPIAIGMALACLVYIGAPLSGAHYNPAVTLALALRHKISGVQARNYIVAQGIGALTAAATTLVVFNEAVVVSPGTGISWISAFVAEALFTFLLVAVILQLCTSKRTKGNQYFGLAIGGSVLVGAFAVGKISGGAFNPAVGIAPLIVNSLLGKAQFDPALFFLYVLGPSIGALGATLLHTYTEKS